MSAKKPMVVVVEDDIWMVGQLIRQLERGGFATAHVTNGLEAMDVIDNTHPDAIILDIFLPGPNGVVLLHELRSHSDLARIPIVVCTTTAADIPKGSLGAYGVRAVLDKTTMGVEDAVAAVRRIVA